MTSRAVESPVAGKGVRSSWGAGVAERVNECADAIDAMRGPGALSSLRETSRGMAPFAVRFHVTEDDTDGKWEIYLPPGCVAVGGDCDPLNLPASAVSGHEDDGDNWYLLHVDDSEATAETITANGQTVTLREWYVRVHAKCAAKVDGVDELDAPQRRMFYVAAAPVIAYSQNESPTAAERAKYRWGDDFEQTIGKIVTNQWPAPSGGETPPLRRAYVSYLNRPISVQGGRVQSNFDLVWYFSVDEDDGDLAVEHVYCVRSQMDLAGTTAKGPTMTEVTDAQESIYARITTNPLSGEENVIAVIVDPDRINNIPDEEYITWLHLYTIANNLVSYDWRHQSLVSYQYYRI